MPPLNCPSEGLIEGSGYELHMSDPTGTTFTKVLNIQSIGTPGSGTYSTDEVGTLDDKANVPVPTGRLGIDPVEITGVRKSGDTQQVDLHALFRAKECRKWRVIAPDAKKTTYEFCAHITGWKPVVDPTKKDRLNFTLTPAGDYIIKDSDGQIWPEEEA